MASLRAPRRSKKKAAAETRQRGVPTPPKGAALNGRSHASQTGAVPSRGKRTLAEAAQAVQAARVQAEVAARASNLPPREWDRGTELVKLFAATGFIYNTRAQSLLLAGEPGTGKTELLDRFRPNRNCSFHSDLTVRQLYPVLRKAQREQVTHIVLTEFQKLMMRKMSVAENLLGTLVQAMEEGVNSVSVGPGNENYGGVRIGVIGAITNGTVNRKRDFLTEMGFLSRAACFEWDMPPAEEQDIMQRISHNNFADLEPIHLARPVKRVTVELAPALSEVLEKYAWDRRSGKALRFFNRLRSLTQAAALLDGRDVVNKRDVEWVCAFDVYWTKLMD